MTPPTTAREFAERLLDDDESFSDMSSTSYKAAFALIDQLVTERDEAIREAAIRECIAACSDYAVEREAHTMVAHRRADHRSQDILEGQAEGAEDCSKRLAKLLPPAEKAGPT